MKPDPNMITLSFYKEILKVFSNIQTFSAAVDTCCLQCNIPFYVWVNVFFLPLLVGHSARVPSKRKKGIEENETAHPTGTVHEL